MFSSIWSPSPAGYVIGVKFLTHQKPEGGHPSGASDLRLAKTATQLIRASRSMRHAAHKCALLIYNMIAKWENWAGMKPAAPGHSMSTSSDSGSSDYADIYFSDTPPLAPPEPDLRTFLKMTTDADFWKAMQNQKVAVGYPWQIFPWSSWIEAQTLAAKGCLVVNEVVEKKVFRSQKSSLATREISGFEGYHCQFN
ncbi:hypothetical protein K438DRAFT_1999579 [Mycena galopus ATCC 62051]|nr:hypothetical protein K438DRAFT_1999579 [Mycena galopus ATCC 62051]